MVNGVVTSWKTRNHKHQQQHAFLEVDAKFVTLKCKIYEKYINLARKDVNIRRKAHVWCMFFREVLFLGNLTFEILDIIFTASKRSWGKIMFLYLSVCPQQGCLLWCHNTPLPRQHTPWTAHTHPGQHTSPWTAHTFWTGHPTNRIPLSIGTPCTAHLLDSTLPWTAGEFFYAWHSSEIYGVFPKFRFNHLS